jgi:ABC-type glutathione transport system ATPase component
VSHDLPAIERFTDRTVLMERGKIVADGPPHSIVRFYTRELPEASKA